MDVEVYEISAPGLPETILLCPDEIAPKLRAKLTQRGNPGRTWSFSEISDLKHRGVSREEARKLAEAKMLLQGGALLWTKERPAVQVGMDF